MKIHPSSINNSKRLQGHRFNRLPMILGILALAFLASTPAMAQTKLFGEKSSSSAVSTVNPVKNGLFTLGNENFKVVDVAAFRTAADVGTTEHPSIVQVGCQACRVGACNGNCGRSLSNGALNYSIGQACAPCIPVCYFSVELLYMERQGNENFTNSPNFRMSEFDFEWVPRLTIGRIPDCVHGCEFSFIGPAEWDRFGARSDSGGGIQTFLTPISPFTDADLSAFRNAERQIQTWTAQYWGCELNSTLVGYDVARLLVGLRYVDYDEKYNYFSQTATQSGLLRSEVKNQMIGLQCGMDLLYPLCHNGYADFRSRAGIFANYAELDGRFVNANTTFVSTRQDDTGLAGVLEIAGGFRYQVTDCFSLRAGGELWWLGGMATAPDQFKNSVSQLQGVRTKDDFVVAGATFGAELRY